jgi:hypothetical protein
MGSLPGQEAAVAFDWRVLAGGEGLAEGKRVLHDLQDEVHLLVGGVHEERRWNKVDGEEWRRPWRRVLVPDEGPANMVGWSTQASWIRGDAIPVPDSAGGGAEGGCRRGGGSGFHRRRWRHGVLVVGVFEGGEGVARKLLRDYVVLLVP